MSESNSKPDGLGRLYFNDEHYSVVWNGSISINSLHEEERNLFDKYSKFVEMKFPNKREVVYLTPDDNVQFHLDDNAVQNVEHKMYLNNHDDEITFARIDNELFALWADIWDNNGHNERSEIGIKLHSPPILEIVRLLNDTIIPDSELNDEQQSKVLSDLIKMIEERYQSA